MDNIIAKKETGIKSKLELYCGIVSLLIGFITYMSAKESIEKSLDDVMSGLSYFGSALNEGSLPGIKAVSFGIGLMIVGGLLIIGGSVSIKFKTYNIGWLAKSIALVIVFFGILKFNSYYGDIKNIFENEPNSGSAIFFIIAIFVYLIGVYQSFIAKDKIKGE